MEEGSWTRLGVDNPVLSCFNSQHVLAFAMGTHRTLGADCAYVTTPRELVQRILSKTQVIFPHPRFLSETTLPCVPAHSWQPPSEGRLMSYLYLYINIYAYVYAYIYVHAG